MTTRSCSTWLCLMLCSSAEGMVSALEAMNTDVPRTRCSDLAVDLMNTGSGIASSANRSRSSSRPVAQVVSTTKITAATTSGNQPPSAILVRLDAK